MKFREFATLSGKKILAGKSAENNEELIAQSGENEIILHTKEPGSAFVNIKADSSEVSKEDIKEAAIFCSRHSQDWRDNQREVVVHYFLGKNIYKDKKMKIGTFGIKNFKSIKIKKIEIKNFEKAYLK